MANKSSKPVAVTSPEVKKTSSDEPVVVDLQNYLIPISILIGALMIAASILFSFKGVTKNSVSSNSSSSSVLSSDSTGSQATVNITTDMVKNLFVDGMMKFNDTSKKVLFVEFSDPSCPYCHVAGGMDPELNKQVGTQFVLKADGGTYVAPVPEIKKLVDSGDAGFVYVYTMGHGSGEIAATALYCAYANNKFWEVHDKLMSNAGYTFMNNSDNSGIQYSGTKQATDTDLTRMADFLKDVFDYNTMNTCLLSRKYVPNIARDNGIASTFGISGTPGFVVNTTFYGGAYSFTDMQSVVNAALK